MNWFEKNTNLQTIITLDNNLNRLKNACIAAGSPHLKIKNIIHVAGTNGKGSTIAFLQSILREAGYKVNYAISPHLIKFNERINLNGIDISDDTINEICEKYEDIMNKYHLSFFERSILVAFIAFSISDADFNIIEVGLGGTLDATNVIENPKICVITSIGLDHCAILGNTVEEIAINKAGIIKSNAKVVVGYNSENIIKTITNNRENMFYIGGKDWLVDKNLAISLSGEHQYYNAGNALAVIELLKKEFNIGEKAIKNGLLKTVWPARMQKIGNIIIDGAHNIDGIIVLADYLKKINGLKVGIMAIMKDKNVDDICTKIANIFDIIYCVPITGSMSPRAMSADDLAKKLQKNNINSVAIDEIDKVFALEDIINAENIVVFGSLFLAGKVIKFLEKN